MTLTRSAADPGTAMPARPTGPTGPTEDSGPAGTRRWLGDLLAAVGYLGGAVYVMAHLIAAADTRAVSWGTREQLSSEWMLRHGAAVVSRLAPAFSAARPDGSGTDNVLTAHGFPGLSLPLSPLTLVLGPARTFALAVTLCLAGTAYAWYHVLSRHLVRHRLAAVLAGGLGGFAPAMVAHAQGDLGRVAQFLVPFLIWQGIRLRERGSAVRNGLVLGLLVVWQALIDEEILLFVALGWAVFVAAYAVLRPAEVRAAAPAVLRGLGIAAAVATVALAYPLWTQWSAPTRPPTANRNGVDVFSYLAFPVPSLATWPIGQLHHARRVTEQNTFYGWPLLIVLGALLWRVRGAVVRALALAAGALAVLSFGTELTFKGAPMHIPGPWRWLSLLPLVRSIPAVDVALAVLPVVVLLFAFVADWGTALVRRQSDGLSRLAWYGVLAAALVPIAPTPVSAVGVTAPAWRTATAPLFVTDPAAGIRR